MQGIPKRTRVDPAPPHAHAGKEKPGSAVTGAPFMIFYGKARAPRAVLPQQISQQRVDMGQLRARPLIGIRSQDFRP